MRPPISGVALRGEPSCHAGLAELAALGVIFVPGPLEPAAIALDPERNAVADVGDGVSQRVADRDWRLASVAFLAHLEQDGSNSASALEVDRWGGHPDRELHGGVGCPVDLRNFEEPGREN